ncbi:hypothetical protein L6164_016859 [Bauhinia variegata]|uniref:Uncharacterized protein n=1 Tax=Bauhinia variegata TaxID=167791 RepID=A0ACB9N6K7_BAUVA|nr:hypothetical protein L6164_016859 [Bauhinia variegata]
MVVTSNHIRFLYLEDISSLTSFPTEGLPTLQTLTINKCRNLEFQTEETWYNYKSLQELRIWNSCHSLTSFSLDCFPALKFLDIWRCPNLKSISILGDVSDQSLSCLETLHLRYCPNLESFLQGGLHSPNLSFLSIEYCKRLASLPEQIGTLTTLQDLCLVNHRSLVSCPQGDLPPKLQSLVFKIKTSPLCIDEWRFQQLNCLSRCEITGDELVNALLKVPLLPNSLVSLHIDSLNDLKLLDGRGIRHLSSLKKLYIVDCKSLESLPVDSLSPSLKKLKISDCPLLKFLDGTGIQHLSSLEEIDIVKCKSLKSLPEDRLSPSLKLLIICGCPLLEARQTYAPMSIEKLMLHDSILKCTKMQILIPMICIISLLATREQVIHHLEKKRSSQHLKEQGGEQGSQLQ